MAPFLPVERFVTGHPGCVAQPWRMHEKRTTTLRHRCNQAGKGSVEAITKWVLENTTRAMRKNRDQKTPVVVFGWTFRNIFAPLMYYKAHMRAHPTVYALMDAGPHDISLLIVKYVQRLFERGQLGADMRRVPAPETVHRDRPLDVARLLLTPSEQMVVALRALTIKAHDRDHEEGRLRAVLIELSKPSPTI